MYLQHLVTRSQRIFHQIFVYQEQQQTVSDLKIKHNDCLFNSQAVKRSRVWTCLPSHYTKLEGPRPCVCVWKINRISKHFFLHSAFLIHYCHFCGYLSTFFWFLTPLSFLSHIPTSSLLWPFTVSHKIHFFEIASSLLKQIVFVQAAFTPVQIFVFFLRLDLFWI